MAPTEAWASVAQLTPDNRLSVDGASCMSTCGRTWREPGAVGGPRRISLHKKGSSMTRSLGVAARLCLAAATLAAAAPARAIPAFARKYGTSCLTCHTVYPKLTPFGEAFRRNGYRFPGVDSDYVKQETVAMGQEANKKTFPQSVWPSTIPGSLPVAFGANGVQIGRAHV